MSSVREEISQSNLTSQTDQGSKLRPRMTIRANQHTPEQPKDSITTEDVLRCLENSNLSLTMDADEVWLNLVYTGGYSEHPPLSVPSTCWLHVRVRRQGIMSLLIFNMTSVADNKMIVHSSMRNRERYDYDPLGWMSPGVELAMTSDYAEVSIQINDVHAPYSLHAQFKTVPMREEGEMEIREVTDNLGFIQSSGWTERIRLQRTVELPPYMPYRLIVPAAHSVMLSVVHMNLADVPQCPFNRLSISALNVDVFLPRSICNMNSFSPVVSTVAARTRNLWLSYRINDNRYEYEFRLLFTFHKRKSQPERPSFQSLWNCSVPFWFDFHLHLICNHHKECISGKDERDCPWKLCKEEDVQLPDSCVRLVKHDGPVSRAEARDSCVRLGGVLAILSRAQHWVYVSRVFRYHLKDKRLVFMGLTSSPEHLPSM